MGILFNKWCMLYITCGIGFLLIGAPIYLFVNENVGMVLIMIYIIPLLIWALLVLIFITKEFIKDEFF